jgi:hypothetical protein
VRSAGVGSGIAGFGAGLIVIDDPVKNRADAESSNNREKVDDWFKNDVYTRMEPNASIILISTRWHEDDLAGRLQREMAEGGEQWEVISLAALAEPPASAGGEEITEPNGEHDARALPAADPLGRSAGEALCPQRYGVETLERYRRKLGSYAFAALYQQRPQSAEGGTFKRAWFGKGDRSRSAGAAVETRLRPGGFDKDDGRFYGELSRRDGPGGQSVHRGRLSRPDRVSRAAALHRRTNADRHGDGARDRVGGARKGRGAGAAA